MSACFCCFKRKVDPGEVEGEEEEKVVDVQQQQPNVQASDYSSGDHNPPAANVLESKQKARPASLDLFSGTTPVPNNGSLSSWARDVAAACVEGGVMEACKEGVEGAEYCTEQEVSAGMEDYVYMQWSAEEARLVPVSQHSCSQTTMKARKANPRPKLPGFAAQQKPSLPCPGGVQSGSDVPQPDSDSEVPQADSDSGVLQSDSGVPRFRSKLLQSGSEVSQSILQYMPQSNSEMPQSDSMNPQSGSNVSQCGAEGPQSSSNLPQSDFEVPQVDSEEFQIDSGVVHSSSAVRPASGILYEDLKSFHFNSPPAGRPMSEFYPTSGWSYQSDSFMPLGEPGVPLRGGLGDSYVALGEPGVIAARLVSNRDSQIGYSMVALPGSLEKVGCGLEWGDDL